MRLRLLFKYLNYYNFSSSILQNFYFCFSFKWDHICPELSWQPQGSWSTQSSVVLCYPKIDIWAWPPLLSYVTAHRSPMRSFMGPLALFHQAIFWGAHHPAISKCSSVVIDNHYTLLESNEETGADSNNIRTGSTQVSVS